MPTPILDLDPNAPDPIARRRRRLERSGVLAFLLALIAAILALRALRYRAFIHQPPVLTNAAARPLADTVNPNTASWASLARLPGIGEARARNIVDFRTRWAQTHPDSPHAFTSPADLLQVKNIGPVTLEGVTPYLAFDNP